MSVSSNIVYDKGWDTNGGANRFWVEADSSGKLTAKVWGNSVQGTKKVDAKMLAALWDAKLVQDGEVKPNKLNIAQDNKFGTPNNVNIVIDSAKFTVKLGPANVNGTETYKFDSLKDAQNFKAFLEDFKAQGLLDEIS